MDLSNLSNLTYLFCSNNLFTSLNLNNNPLIVLQCNNEAGTGVYLETLFIKNGAVLGFTYPPQPPASFLPTTLKYICVDNSVEEANIDMFYNINNYSDYEANTYCNFVPGGDYYTIQGQVKFDLDNDNCDTIDPFYPNLRFSINNGSDESLFISNNSGFYSFSVLEGIYTITPQLENPDFFSVYPNSITVDFSVDPNPLIQDFCVIVTPHNDLEINLLPLNQARPGFDSDYKLIYKNKGNTILSGTINLDYLSDFMNLDSSNPLVNTQTTNTLTWNYSNIQPLETREILFTMNLNTPTETPPLNGGDELGFIATINPVTGDETPEDNTISIEQLVVNSYDPNDKTCLEGETITPELVGEFVHYLIRFENTGTANAINVVVKDEIDLSKFDISTLFITDTSHEMITRINDNNVVEFIFENINLPFDDANNDGYIAFKIKTLDTLIEGDTFDNDAEIYFDFNFPIITNNYVTAVEEPLSIEEFGLINLEAFPNPTKNLLNIKVTEAIKSVLIYDISGRVINSISVIGNRNEITVNTSKLNSGVYFVKITTEAGEGVRKIIKE